MQFEQDLELWKQVEREFAQKLFKYDIVSIEFMQWEFKDYDIKAKFRKDGQVVERTYEVKIDTISNRSGKVAFEYECNWKPSWIISSKADYIVYKLGDDFYYTERWRLINELMEWSKEKAQGWNYWRSKLWIIPKELFFLIAHKM